jgi:calcineurin-like phosphoesterase family protein
MNEVLINNHNSLVKKEDTIIHIGDFCFGKPDDFESIVSRLNGTHYIMDGSHDKSLRAFFETRPSSPLITSGKVSLLPKLFEFTFNGEKIILCHYAMKKWWASHHGSFHFYGHSHGNDLEPLQNSRDIGVDTTNFFPVLIEDAIESVRRNSEINEDFEQK